MTKLTSLLQHLQDYEDRKRVARLYMELATIIGWLRKPADGGLSPMVQFHLMADHSGVMRRESPALRIDDRLARPLLIAIAKLHIESLMRDGCSVEPYARDLAELMQ